MFSRKQFDDIYLNIHALVQGDVRETAYAYDQATSHPDGLTELPLPAEYAETPAPVLRKTLARLAAFFLTHSLYGGDVDGAYNYYIQQAAAARRQAVVSSGEKEEGAQ